MVSREIREILLGAGIENASQEAEWIIKYQKRGVAEAVERRLSGEPLQYILGEWEFYGCNFKVGEGVFIPRPETELLVDLAAEWGREHASASALDLCAGSGCVAIAFAKATGCERVVAVEKSPEAVEYLKQNIRLNKVESRVSAVKEDVLKPRGDFRGFDCVLINAPYLSASEMLTLQKEVTFEPREALYGGEDGLDFYREFFGLWGERLRNAEFFACEVGDGQAARVCRLMRGAGLSPRLKKDRGGTDRIVYSIKE
ncbi:MAG: peptide chain release factor N(5)-glutamine methyltransferase [Oscillospiraceae bacterium]|jgi:release factor glutamine methyltransferase|nr:peptide chain release factor N(5)-glutamine methyltransferase [Oscillospiraceae bacterium]